MADRRNAPDGLSETLLKYVRLNYALDARMFALEPFADEGAWIGSFSSSTKGTIKMLAEPHDDRWEFRKLLSGKDLSNVSLRTVTEIRKFAH